MENELFIPPERLLFVDRQRFTAEDLHDSQRYERMLAWLHNRSFHEWGIIFGFDVRVDDGGQKVIVEPGYAYDSSGRELISTSPVSLPVPETREQQFAILVMQYPPEDAQNTDETCPPRNARRFNTPELPAFTWLLAERAEFGDHVPLAAAVIHNGAVRNDLDFRARRAARPLINPRMVWGAADDVQWASAGDLGIKATIATEEARFTSTPFYFAWLELDSLNGLAGSFVLDAFSYILNPESASFEICVMSSEFLPGLFVMDQDPKKIRWRVIWLGIEPLPNLPA
jgi:hypothetical protein